MGLLDKLNAGTTTATKVETKKEEVKEVQGSVAPTVPNAGGMTIPNAGGLSLLDQIKQMAEKSPTAEFEEIPAGTYSGYLKEVAFVKSRKGHDMLKIDVMINGEIHPSFKNQHIFNNILLAYDPITDEHGVQRQPDWIFTNAKRALTTLAKFGIDTTTQETMSATLPLALNKEVVVTITENKSKDGDKVFRNISYAVTQ